MKEVPVLYYSDFTDKESETKKLIYDKIIV